MKQTVEQYKRKIASAGGKARAASMTPKQRSDSARKAGKARWAKKGKTR